MRIEQSAPTVSEYKKMRDCVGWWKTDDNGTEVALSNSLFSVVAIENKNIVGLCRVVGDRGLYFYI